jgi:hypothetical protein
MPYEVLDDEVTVLRTTASLRQQDGSTIYQNGMGRTYLKGEVIADENVAEDWKEALESGEGALFEALSTKLKVVTDDPKEDSPARLGLPFEGYDDMDPADVVAAMRLLPSATINRIKDYEETRGAEARAEIMDYNIGYGEAPLDRQTTELEDRTGEQDPDKAVRVLTTREVPEDGTVQPGEGFTGTGDPDKPYGVEKAAEEGDEEAQVQRATSKGRGNIASARKGRRERQPKPSAGEKEGGTSLQSSND